MMHLVSWVQSVFKAGTFRSMSSTFALRPTSQVQPGSIKELVDFLTYTGLLKTIDFNVNKVHVVEVSQRNRPHISDGHIFLHPEGHEEIISKCASLLRDGHVVGINLGHIEETPAGSEKYSLYKGIFEIKAKKRKKKENIIPRLSQETIDEISERVGIDFHFDMEPTAKKNPHTHHYSFYIVLAPKGKLQIKE